MYPVSRKGACTFGALRPEERNKKEVRLCHPRVNFSFYAYSLLVINQTQVKASLKVHPGLCITTEIPGQARSSICLIERRSFTISCRRVDGTCKPCANAFTLIPNRRRDSSRRISRGCTGLIFLLTPAPIENLLMVVRVYTRQNSGGSDREFSKVSERI